MAEETIKPGYAYKSDVATANYADNRIEIKGTVSNIKIMNDSGNPLQYVLNVAEDSTDVDGEILANEKDFKLDDLDFGISSIAIKGNGAYRLWVYA